ncbi:hypothetical protein LINGRAHAP2_LOCUS30817 [Linum grandiflorum]
MENEQAAMLQKHRPLRIMEPSADSQDQTMMNQSLDTVLKSLEKVLTEFADSEVLPHNLIDEQQAIKAVPREVKAGRGLATHIMATVEEKPPTVGNPRLPTSKKRQRLGNQGKKPDKKHHGEEDMVETASQKWLPDQK